MFGNIVRQLLEDAQQRIVFRAQVRNNNIIIHLHLHVCMHMREFHSAPDELA